MSFDNDFEAAFASAFANSFGEPMDYAGPGGAPTVSAVPVVLNESQADLDAGEGLGRMRVDALTGSAFRSAFGDVEPVSGGVFTRASGVRLRIAHAPSLDTVGEWTFSLERLA